MNLCLKFALRRDSLEALAVVNDLAILLKRMKRLNEAHDCYKQLVKGYNEQCGPNAESTQIVQFNYAKYVLL